MKKGNPAALLPIGVFLLMYLGLGLVLQYGMGIDKGFYCVPIIGAFLLAILTACLQNRKTTFDEKLAIMGRGVGDKNIITMLLIFLTAGAFVGVVGRSCAQSVAYFMLDLIPARFAVAVIFIVACFVSTAMGTSVGTNVAATNLAMFLGNGKVAFVPTQFWIYLVLALVFYFILAKTPYGRSLYAIGGNRKAAALSLSLIHI